MDYQLNKMSDLIKLLLLMDLIINGGLIIECPTFDSKCRIVFMNGDGEGRSYKGGEANHPPKIKM